MKAKIQELESRFPTAIPHVEALSEKLKPLGVNEDNTYLFAQGHTIKDNVILMFLKPIFSHLKKEKEDEIKAKAKHNEELLNQLALYKNQVIPIDNVLNTNTAFKSCFLYQKLHADLTRYVEQFKEAQII